ncbi:MAG: vWA domain-containing protein [Fuerstiella sp.]
MTVTDSDLKPPEPNMRDWLMSMPLWRPERFRRVMPFAASFVLHVVLLTALALWVLPVLTSGSDIRIDAAFALPTVEEPQALIDTVLDVELSERSPLKVSEQLASASTARPPQHTSTRQPARVRVPQPPRAFDPSVPSVHKLTDEELATEIPVMMAAMPIHAHRGETRVAEAESTGDIAAQLSGDLRQIAGDGDAIVVWMLDQSLSMQLDMKHLAEYLVSTLEQIEEDKNTRMQHYVVAFGDDVQVVQDITDRGRAVARAIYNLPPDPSGIENTFQSVEWCVDNLFNHRRWLRYKDRQKLLVVWTDESGDDYLLLEHAIQKCLRSNVRVEIIGPSAVLGAQTGYTAYPHPADGKTYYLPVHRGPDSSFPQKLQLGYWYRGVPGTYHESMRGPYQGTSPRWQGGSNLTAMLSGFSPYALTRLARETGGRYTMYDRPGDRAPFRLETLQEYMPDYRSLAEIEFDLRRQPLRQLILASAAVTWKSNHTRRSEPAMQFLRNVGWKQPAEFRRLLRGQLQQPILDALRASADVEKALSLFAMASATPEWRPAREIPASESPGTEPINMSENDDAVSELDAEQPADQKTDPAAAKGSAADGNPTDGNPTDGDPTDGKPADQDPSDTEPSDTEPMTEADVDARLAQQAEHEADVRLSLLEQLYLQEPSRRWRAWSDLNLGRLLMVSVRLREYIAATGYLWQHTDKLARDTNYVTLTSVSIEDSPAGIRSAAAPESAESGADNKPQTSGLRGGAASAQRLEIARMLLQRCIEENAGTPWAIMAERELRDPVGLQINERSLPRPRLTRPGRPPRPVWRPPLPSL